MLLSAETGEERVDEVIGSMNTASANNASKHTTKSGKDNNDIGEDNDTNNSAAAAEFDNY